MQTRFKTPRPRRFAVALAGVLALRCAACCAAVAIVQGTVGGVSSDAVSSSASAVPSVYAGATVCFDLNGNGVCDPGEPATTSSATGRFKLSSPALAPLIAQIGSPATNNGHAIGNRYVFRANVAQIQAATRNPMLAATVNLTPLSTEMALAIENQGLTAKAAVAHLAQRLGVASTNVLLAPTQVTHAAEQAAIVKASVIAQGRLVAP
jgi:hypothetical protein